MRRLRLVRSDTRIDFMGVRKVALAFTIFLTLASLASLAIRGLELGLDFTGGILIEARSAQPVRVDELRSDLDALALGGVVLQTSGDRDILIRVQYQAGGEAQQVRAIAAVKQTLGAIYEIRRTEFVGPSVSRELLWDGLVAAGFAVTLIAAYVWLRFEWQFGVSAMITTVHDVIATFGLFSLLGLEFDLTVVAAVLTIAGYSINDTVVVFDRIRENLRRYKQMGLRPLINLSLNQTLSRTLLTSGTTMLAVLALLLLGGPVLRNFAAALAWGILVGTCSSIFVASMLLLNMPPVRGARDSDDTTSGADPDRPIGPDARAA